MGCGLEETYVLLDHLCFVLVFFSLGHVVEHIQGVVRIEQYSGFPGLDYFVRVVRVRGLSIEVDTLSRTSL